MAIEVTRKGTAPIDRKYECECIHCYSTLTFLRGDVKCENDRDGRHFRFTCPVCKTELFISTTTTTEITPRIPGRRDVPVFLAPENWIVGNRCGKSGRKGIYLTNDEDM